MVSKTLIKQVRYSLLITLIMAMSLNSIYAQADGASQVDQPFDVVVQASPPCAGGFAPTNPNPTQVSWSPVIDSVLNQNLLPDPLSPAEEGRVVLDLGFMNGEDQCSNGITATGTVMAAVSFTSNKITVSVVNCAVAPFCIASETASVVGIFYVDATAEPATYNGLFEVVWTP